MNKHTLLAILLIAIFFMFTACGAKEMFNPSPDAIDDEIMSDIVVNTPMNSDYDMDEAMSPTMNSDSVVDMSVGQPAAPMPSDEPEMGYYNFAKIVYM